MRPGQDFENGISFGEECSKEMLEDLKKDIQTSKDDDADPAKKAKELEQAFGRARTSYNNFNSTKMKIQQFETDDTIKKNAAMNGILKQSILPKKDEVNRLVAKWEKFIINRHFEGKGEPTAEANGVARSACIPTSEESVDLRTLSLRSTVCLLIVYSLVPILFANARQSIRTEIVKDLSAIKTVTTAMATITQMMESP